MAGQKQSSNGHARTRKRLKAVSRKQSKYDLHEMPTAREEHRKHGKSLRAKCPRSKHSESGIRQAKRDPLGLIERSNEGRVEELLPVRFTRMLESSFAFFRGTAVVQAHDLANTPTSGIIVQACGDCHLMNFGGFASPERTLIFDINDFDETLPAPFEWDVKRLAASFVLAAGWRGFGKSFGQDITRAAIKAYREQMARSAKASALDVWYARITADDAFELIGKDWEQRKVVERDITRAKKHTSETVFHKITQEVNGRPRIMDQPPLLYHLAPEQYNSRERLDFFFEAYRNSMPADRRLLFDRYRLIDGVFKVVGIGSVGTLCYVSLWMADANDPLFLQVKQARLSVLEGLAGPSKYEHQGERVVVGQRIMQSASDIFLGWATGLRGNDFYVRQLRDQKVSLDMAAVSAKYLHTYAQLCGRTLARAHAKSGNAAEISGYLGAGSAFEDAITKYAVAYATQVEKDYEAFRAAARNGRFPTETSASETETAMR